MIRTPGSTLCAPLLTMPSTRPLRLPNWRREFDAVIRRAEHATPASRKHVPAQGRSVYVDPSNLSVVVDARHIRLTPRQIELVSLLESRNPTNPLSLERIRQIISDKKVYKLSKETIRVHISMVNKKLTEAAVANVRICRNVQGYYMQSA
ncbi:MAG: hypothetical protein ACMVO3_13810 [Thalassobaculum sp.]